jgi:translation initiation factor IF-1
MSDALEISGVIDRVLGNNNYEVLTEIGGKEVRILCYLSGKMRQFKISVLAGDKVKIEVPPPFDKGRITFREK